MVIIKLAYNSILRRFEVPETITWAEFEVKIRDLYGLGSQPLTVSYIDEDGDIISFNTDYELKTILALASAGGKPLKLELTDDNPAAAPPETSVEDPKEQSPQLSTPQTPGTVIAKEPPVPISNITTPASASVPAEGGDAPDETNTSTFVLRINHEGFGDFITRGIISLRNFLFPPVPRSGEVSPADQDHSLLETLSETQIFGRPQEFYFALAGKFMLLSFIMKVIFSLFSFVLVVALTALVGYGAYSFMRRRRAACRPRINPVGQHIGSSLDKINRRLNRAGKKVYTKVVTEVNKRLEASLKETWLWDIFSGSDDETAASSSSPVAYDKNAVQRKVVLLQEMGFENVSESFIEAHGGDMEKVLEALVNQQHKPMQSEDPK